MDREYLSWGDVENLAGVIFNVWTSRGDFEWARTAWAILGEQGLTALPPEEFDDGRERIRILGRLVALGGLYHSFLSSHESEGNLYAMEWCAEDRDLCDTERILRFRRGPLWNHETTPEEPWTKSELREFCAEVLQELVEEEYPTVRAAVMKGFGGETGLFVSLWLTRSGEFPGWRCFPDDVVGAVVNGDTKEFGMVAAFNWLRDGAHLELNWS